MALEIRRIWENSTTSRVWNFKSQIRLSNSTGDQFDYSNISAQQIAQPIFGILAAIDEFYQQLSLSWEDFGKMYQMGGCFYLNEDYQCS